jgi:hypothetical protein
MSVIAESHLRKKVGGISVVIFKIGCSGWIKAISDGVKGLQMEVKAISDGVSWLCLLLASNFNISDSNSVFFNDLLIHYLQHEFIISRIVCHVIWKGVFSLIVDIQSRYIYLKRSYIRVLNYNQVCQADPCKGDVCDRSSHSWNCALVAETNLKSTWSTNSFIPVLKWDFLISFFSFQ